VQRNLALLVCGCLFMVGVALILRQGAGEEAIAWTVAEDEQLRAVAGPLAVTTSDRELVARDAATGARRWTSPTRPAAAVQIVGDSVVVTDRDGGLRVLSADTGRERWSAEPVDGRRVFVGSSEAIAFTQCEEPDLCVAESRVLANGWVNWTAPVAPDDMALGSGIPEGLLTGDFAVWPSTHAIVPAPTGRGFEVRDLETGEAAVTGRRADGEALVLAGRTLVRSVRRAGVWRLTGTDLTGRAEPWSQDVPVQPLNADGGGTRLTLADGSLVLVGRPTAMPRVTLHRGERLQTVDPATGRLTATANELPDRRVTVVSGEVPAGPARVPVLAALARGYGVQFGGRVEKVDERIGLVVSTADQVAWSAGGTATVADRGSGDDVVERDGDVGAIGDRIVIRDEDDELLVVARPDD
jgi:hypothetical protein